MPVPGGKSGRLLPADAVVCLIAKVIDEPYGHRSVPGPDVAVLPAGQHGSALSAVDTSIVVALITSITSIIVASSTALWTVWQTRQQSQSQAKDPDLCCGGKSSALSEK